MILDHRIFHIIKKEFIQLVRDKRIIGITIVAPIIQLILFGYVATTDVKNIRTVVLDENRTYISRALISKFENSGYFDVRYYAKSEKQEKSLLDSGDAKIAINIPSDYSNKIASGKKAAVQFIVDGTNSNSAGITISYINGIIYQYSIELLNNRVASSRNSPGKLDLIDLRLRVFHNQELKSVYYMIPGIIATLLMILTAVLTSVSIVKEKEYGTLEQLIVSPIKPWELMVGKMIPFICLSFIDICLVLLVGKFWFGVPILGSIPLLFLLCFVFLSTSLGLGLYISAVSATMQQTILSIIFIMLPFIMLSGFIFPIANMPFVIQVFTYLIPMRYFLNIVRGIFLKGTGIEYLWQDTLALAVLGFGIFYLAVKRFRKKLE